MPDDIRVLVADDSATVRHYLTTLINETPGMQVVDTAADGRAAIRGVAEHAPDVISMDVNMPEMDGLAATAQIMQQQPTPIVVVSGYLESDVELSLKALEAGALAVVGKPPNRTHPEFRQRQRELLNTLRAMAQVHVIQRRIYPRPATGNGTASGRYHRRVRPQILAIGASTGGPGALYQFLGALPADFSLPIVIAQHMPQEFIAGLVRWLNAGTALDVRVASAGDRLQPGCVLVAPGDKHMVVQRQQDVLRVDLQPGDDALYRYCPSVDALFHSVAQTCAEAAAGLLLTGMGTDGAAGLLAMRRAGAMTLAQDETSCVVYGMPGAAVHRGAVQHIKKLADLPLTIQKLL